MANARLTHEHDLNQTALKLGEVRAQLRKAEEDKMQMIMELERTRDDLDQAFESFHRYDSELKKERLENQVRFAEPSSIFYSLQLPSFLFSWISGFPLSET